MCPSSGCLFVASVLGAALGGRNGMPVGAGGELRQVDGN